MGLSPRTLKAYGIGLALIWLYTICGVFFSAVVYPNALSDSGSDQPRTLVIHTKQR